MDSKIGLDIDVSVKCSGVYSFKISNPLLFYTNVCGNVVSEYRRDEMKEQMRTEFVSALAPALAKLSALELRPNEIIAHTTDLENAMRDVLSAKWSELRGLTVTTIALNPISLPEEDAQLIKNAQHNAIMRDPTMAAATLVGAQAEAMKTAAGNQAGAMTGFMGMGMAMNQGGTNAQNLFAMGAQQNGQQAGQRQEKQPADGWKCSCGATATGKFCTECGAKKPETKVPGEWSCTCGVKNSGKFCTQCGSPKPTDADGWICSCGAVNKGKFCPECGAKKPAEAKLYKCDKCGWEPADPAHPPKFCPECGDPFNDDDAK